MKKALGIDFGTSNTTACVLGDAGEAVPVKFADGYEILPTVVYFGPNNEIIVGKEAKNLKAAYPDDVVVEVKRQAGATDPDGRPAVRHVGQDNKNWTGEEIAGLVLAKVKKDAETVCGDEMDTVLITVPACFNQSQREFIINAAKIAGFLHVHIMDEPTAAAVAYGLSKSPGTYAVTDLGGGTYDVTVVTVDTQGNVTAIATGGKSDLGGIDWDMVLIARVMKEAESAGVEKALLEDPAVRQDIKERAETLKHSLSVRTEAQFSMFLGGKRVSFTYTRDEFEHDTSSLMEQVVAITRETMNKESLEPKNITDTILVGGATRMPMFAVRLTELMGKPPRKDADPDMIVAKGAVLTLAKMLQESGEKLLSYKGNCVHKLPGGKVVNCAAHDLGCKAYDASGMNEEFVPIIRKNTKLPAKESQTFAMKDEEQTAVTVSVYQGEAGKALADCLHIDDVHLTDLPVDDPHKPRIVVEYSYTIGGLCDVKVTDTLSGKSATAQISHILGMNEKDVRAGGQSVGQANIQ